MQNHKNWGEGGILECYPGLLLLSYTGFIQSYSGLLWGIHSGQLQMSQKRKVRQWQTLLLLNPLNLNPAVKI